MLAAASCAKNVNWDEVSPVAGQDGITLKFSSGALTKATVKGVDNENRVFQIDYFIFPLDSTGTNGELCVKAETEYLYSGHIDVAEAQALALEYEETIEDADNVFAQIFPNGATKAKVFAVANYVDQFGANNDMASVNTTIPTDVKTWKGLHALEVGPTFFYDDQDPNFLLRWPRVMQPTTPEAPEGDEEFVDQGDLFFVMTGEAVLEFDPKTGAAADVPLKRLASKITVDFTYETVVEEKESGDITWVPQPSGAETRVYLSNAIEHTTLGGPLTRAYVADSWGTATKPLGNGTRDIFEYAYDFMNDIPADADGKKVAHYYTYPINVAEGDDNQPYLKLVLPWYGYKWVGEGDRPATVDPEVPGWQMYKQKEVYYKIVLPRETIKDPNYIYEFSVTVNIIGSDREIKIIGEEYVVKDWLTKDPVSSNVATGRYISLDIPKDEYDMYVDEIDINFVSSGTVIPIVKEIYQLNYSTETPSRDYFMQNNEVTATNALMTAKKITATDIEGWVSIPENSSYLKINHEMDNEMRIRNAQGQLVKNTAFDMAPYVFVVTLHLEAAGDDISFDRTVTITQYPPMFITARTNTNYSHSDNNDDYGYIFVNSQTQNHNNANWYVVRGLDGNNKNPNMYLIRTSVLGDSFDYIIGDPRESNYSTSLGFTPGTGAWTESTGNHQLTYYYPTRTDTDSKKIIAPLFRVASSYGVCGNAISSAEARYRCASYQEDGYPAGRWRVPTASEIEYIATLSANGFIPTLFNVGGTYFSASGAVSIGNNGNVTETTSNNAFVRCVYDEWYWGSDRLADINVFTWGDRLR